MRSTRALRTAAAVAAALAVGPGAGVASAGPPAQVAATCSPPAYPGSGYFTSLTAKNVGCATARKVTLAHYRCRTRTGKRGRCDRRVLRYRCSETRTSISTELNGRVTCRRGARRVVYTYQQNL